MPGQRDGRASARRLQANLGHPLCASMILGFVEVGVVLFGTVEALDVGI